ncbi:MAG: hypothetical protein ACJAZO_000257 [Myxococcota bacterium]|jgi:hypothetical protein
MTRGAMTGGGIVAFARLHTVAASVRVAVVIWVGWTQVVPVADAFAICIGHQRVGTQCLFFDAV